MTKAPGLREPFGHLVRLSYAILLLVVLGTFFLGHTALADAKDSNSEAEFLSNIRNNVAVVLSHDENTRHSRFIIGLYALQRRMNELRGGAIPLNARTASALDDAMAQIYAKFGKMGGPTGAEIHDLVFHSLLYESVRQLASENPTILSHMNRGHSLILNYLQRLATKGAYPGVIGNLRKLAIFRRELIPKAEAMARRYEEGEDPLEITCVDCVIKKIEHLGQEGVLELGKKGKERREKRAAKEIQALEETETAVPVSSFEAKSAHARPFAIQDADSVFRLNVPKDHALFAEGKQPRYLASSQVDERLGKGVWVQYPGLGIAVSFIPETEKAVDTYGEPIRVWNSFADLMSNPTGTLIENQRRLPMRKLLDSVCNRADRKIAE